MSAPPASRLAWLDGLRAIGALSVVLAHLKVLTLDRLLDPITPAVDLGKFGVVLFFVVSGYVIPMSLDRHGDLRRFWIGRIFRIYPAFLASLVLVALVAPFGAAPPEGLARPDPVSSTLTHLSMMFGFTGDPGLVPVYWTLAYEMVFYLIVAALHAVGLARHTHWGVPAVALVALVGGLPILDGRDLPADSRRHLAIVGFTLVAGAVAAALTRRRAVAAAAGLATLGVLAVPVFHTDAMRHTLSLWWTAALLTCMFIGTCIQRVESGTLRPGLGLTLVAGGALAVIAASLRHRPEGLPADEVASIVGTEVGTFAAVAVVFGAAHLARHRPGWRHLAWAGLTSYSLYLLHQPLIWLAAVALRSFDMQTAPLWAQLPTGAALVAAALGLAHLSHRYVEVPGQRLGRRLIAGRPPHVPRQRRTPATPEREPALR